MISIKVILQLLFFIFPWGIRRKILELFFNYKISNSATIGYSIVLAKITILEDGAQIANMSFINNIDKLHLKSNAKIGRRNWITGASTISTKAFSNVENRQCELVIGEHTRIVDRHMFDCSGGVYIGDYTTVAGSGSQILTHSINISTARQMTSPVTIGNYCFIGTKCILLMGSSLPSYSILGAGSVVTKKFREEYSLYAGNPTKLIKMVDKESEYFHREIGNVS